MAERQASRNIEIWHVAHPVADLDQSVAFYCGYLGFELVWPRRVPDYASSIRLSGQAWFTIELFVPLGEEASKPRRAPDHLAFEAIDLDAYRESVHCGGADGPAARNF